MNGSTGHSTQWDTLELIACEPVDDTPQLSRAPELVSREPELGTLVGGRYRLDGVLGRGGMGVVHAAHDQACARHVALKFMTWGGEADRADRESRFVSEVRNATAVRHRHVVEVLDAGLHAGEPYLVMELLVGESLEQRLHRVHTISPEEALALLLPIASALAELHTRGIVHRDVKPSNIFLAEAGGEVVAKLLDFGISRVIADARLTQVGVVVGTPMYMGPEQASGAGATPATEVWSLAVVLYECLTGAGPYRSVEPSVLATLVLAGRVLPLAARYPTLPQQLCRVIESGLVLNPALRCCSMVRFGAALVSAAIADGTPLPSARAAAGIPQYTTWLTGLPAVDAAPTVEFDPGPGAAPRIVATRRVWPLPLAVLALATVAALGAGWGAMRGAASALSPKDLPIPSAVENRVRAQSPTVEVLALGPTPAPAEPAQPAAQGPEVRPEGRGASAPRPKQARSEPTRGGARQTVKTAQPQAEPGPAIGARAPGSLGPLETRWE